MTWLWTDGSAMSYTNFISGQPKTQNNQDCVNMRAAGTTAGKWAHIGCSKSTSADGIQFACERLTECTN